MGKRDGQDTDSDTQYADGSLKLILHQVPDGNFEVMKNHVNMESYLIYDTKILLYEVTSKVLRLPKCRLYENHTLLCMIFIQS